MLKINYCDLYRYSKTSFKNKDKEHIKTKHLFIYLKDIKKLNSLNFNFDLNLKRLIYYLKNKRIDFILSDFACSNTFIIFLLLPEVVRATITSPSFARASNCREKISS